MYSKTSKLLIDEQQKNLELYNQQLHDTYKTSQFLSDKRKFYIILYYITSHSKFKSNKSK